MLSEKGVNLTPHIPHLKYVTKLEIGLKGMEQQDDQF
jgi:hypothetical protein